MTAMSRHPTVMHLGGGTREIERRGVHITVNVTRARSRTRSRTPRSCRMDDIARLVPIVINTLQNRQEHMVSHMHGGPGGGLTVEDMAMVQAMRRGSTPITWSKN